MLRDYQQSSIQKIRAAIVAGRKRIVFVLPTGGGKSVVATKIVQMATEKGSRLVFLVNRADLVKQFSKHLFKAGIQHGILQGQNTCGMDRRVIVGTIQTAARRGMPPCDIAIIDECHSAPGSQQYLNLIFQNKNIPWIGLTATPFSRGMAKKHPELDGEPLFQELVIGSTIKRLVEEGYLVDCEIYAPSEPNMEGVRSKRNQFGELDYNEEDLGKAVDNQALVGDIVAHWFKLAKGKRTVVFATNIAHSQHIVEQFVQCGVKAEHMDCYLHDDDKSDIAKRFASGETTVLSNVAMLREGWDVPACEVMILARPTRSMISWLQMVGRTLRPHEGKTIALILDHSGTVHRLGYPTEDIEIELCDGEKKATENKKQPKEKKENKCPKCHFVKKTPICPKCGYKTERKMDVEVEDGELGKVVKFSKEDKQSLYSELLGFQITHGYKHGWAANQYRSKTQVWPKGLAEVPKKISPETFSWIKSQQIRYAMGKGKHV